MVLFHILITEIDLCSYIYIKMIYYVISWASPVISSIIQEYNNSVHDDDVYLIKLQHGMLVPKAWSKNLRWNCTKILQFPSANSLK
jgi:hypothetical protein